MIETVLSRLIDVRETSRLPSQIRKQYERELSRQLGDDPGIDRSVEMSVEWLRQAQLNSKTSDGGVARHFGLLDGWGASYPETTGYIVPTMITHAIESGDERLMQSARRMIDWLVSIQFPEGGFQGGTIEDKPVVSVVFNTGQILMGLAAGVSQFGMHYEDSMNRAAQWLVDIQDSDGCWRAFESPFAKSGDKTYDTHVAWGLLEAARVSPSDQYATAALKNVDWAITRQQHNGWFKDCCLTDPSRPLTHTIGYTLRGIIEGYSYSKIPGLLAAATNTGNGLLGALPESGALPGRLDNNWEPGVRWVCLTGTVQIAHCWLLLYQFTGNDQYLDAGMRANAFVRRTMQNRSVSSTTGAVGGSFPLSGKYGQFQYLNWAAKFFIDSNKLEKEILEQLR